MILIPMTACAAFSLMKVAADLFQSIIASRLSIRSLLLLNCAATAWIASHAAELAIDPNCLAVAGDSAGGTLAAVVCQSAKHSGLKIALQVLLCPVTDIAPDTQSRREFAEGYFLEGPLMSWAGTHYLPSGFDVSDPRLSPLRAPDLSGLPPAHIFTPQVSTYCATRGKHMPVRSNALASHEHMIHHFYAMGGAIPYARTALKAVGADIKAALSPVKTLSAV